MAEDKRVVPAPSKPAADEWVVPKQVAPGQSGEDWVVPAPAPPKGEISILTYCFNFSILYEISL